MIHDLLEKLSILCAVFVPPTLGGWQIATGHEVIGSLLVLAGLAAMYALGSVAR